MKRWTKQETSILKTNMDSTLSKLKELLPERSEDQILEKIKLLYRETSFDKWTDEELNIIRSNPRKSVFELMKLLPSRTFSAITAKRGEIRGIMGVQQTRNNWTESELDNLKALKKEGYTNYEIANILGRPLNSVIGKLSLENILHNRRSTRGHVWTQKELDFVKEKVASGVSTHKIAGELGLTPSKIFQKAVHLGFRSHDIMTEDKLRLNEKRTSALEEIVKVKAEIKRKDKAIKKMQKQENKYLNKITKLEGKLKKKEL